MRIAEEIRFLVLAAQREGNRMLAAELRPLGITPAQAEVLRLLAERRSLSLSSLGGLLVCESGVNPSRLVDRLVSAGLVHRETDSSDRRAVELTLTPEGKRIARKLTGIENALYESLDAALAGRDVTAITSVLWDFVAGRPAGDALRLRKETS